MSNEELIKFRDTPYLPHDAGEYADDLMDILNRIPEGWGRWISCGPGWYPLLAETNRKMKYLLPNYEIHQVKEKYGTLRFYWGAECESSILAEIMYDIEYAAENKSASICETCGKYGKIRYGGWIRTLCDTHAEENGYLVEEDLGYLMEEDNG